MSETQGDLVLLHETPDQGEVAMVKSLLEAEGIQFVVQGELHSALVPGIMGGDVITPRVLVAQRDLEKAKALLAASPIGEPPSDEGTASLEGAECPVHQKPATATCKRCGTFLCAECKSAPGPAVCEDCAKVDEAEMRAGSTQIASRRRTMVMVVLGLFALFMLLPWLRELF